jgi:hypothetical protein
MKTSQFLSALLVSGSMFLAASLSGNAQTAAFSYTLAYNTSTPPAILAAGGYGLSALEFTITAPITIDDLGFFAISLGGADVPQVNLYSVTPPVAGVTVATELATTGLLPTSSNAFTSNTYNYFPIFTGTSATPGVTLAAGTYLVAAGIYYSPELATTTFTSDISTPSFNTTGGGFGGFDPNGYATLGFGSTAGVGGVYDFNLGGSKVTTEGVNFEYTDVPEPSTYAMLAAGMVLLVAIQRRRLQQA